MNRQDAAHLIELRQHLWTNTPEAGDPLGEIDTWASVLGTLSREQVAQAMVACSTRGDDFAPPIGKLVETLMPTPTYATAWDEFERMLRAGYSSHTVPARDVPWSHPLIAEFAEQGWWIRFGLAPDSAFDQASHAAFRKHFRDGFEACSARATGALLGAAEQNRLEAGTVHELQGGER